MAPVPPPLLAVALAAGAPALKERPHADLVGERVVEAVTVGVNTSLRRVKAD